MTLRPMPAPFEVWNCSCTGRPGSTCERHGVFQDKALRGDLILFELRGTIERLGEADMYLTRGRRVLFEAEMLARFLIHPHVLPAREGC